MFNCRQNRNIIVFLLSYSLTILPVESILPSSIFNYKIKAPTPTIIDESGNTICNKLEDECPDGCLHMLKVMLNSNDNSTKLIGNIAGMYQDFGFTKAIEFIQLVSSFGFKINYDSGDILNFIHKDRKTSKNCDKTAAFLQSFDKAKKRYYYLAHIEKKVLNNQALTSKESKYFLENIDLLDWKYRYKQPLVTRSFLSKFHQWNTQQTHSYLAAYWPSLCMLIFAYIGNVNIGDLSSGNIALCAGLTYGVFGSINGALGANFQVPATEPLIIPTPDILSIEDMSELIESLN